MTSNASINEGKLMPARRQRKLDAEEQRSSQTKEALSVIARWHNPAENMDLTITQNGALFAVQRRPAKRNYRQHRSQQIASPNKTISTLRTPVGEFVLRQTPIGCHLELVGNARWALGSYGTNEAVLSALKNGRTGFGTWDALERKTAANQIDTLSRWNRGEQTA